MKKKLFAMLLVVLISCLGVTTPASAARTLMSKQYTLGSRWDLTNSYIKFGTVNFDDPSKGAKLEVAKVSMSTKDVVCALTLGALGCDGEGSVCVKIEAVDGTWEGEYEFFKGDEIWLGNDHPDGYVIYVKSAYYVGHNVKIKSKDNVKWTGATYYYYY